MAFVHLQKVAVLEFFRADLARFRTGVDESLSAVSGEVNQTLAFVGGRVAYWERQSAAWHAEAERLQGELRRCEAISPGRCDGEHEQLLQSRTMAALAQTNLKEATILGEMLREAGAEFERERRSVQDTLTRVESLAAAALRSIAARARRVHAEPLLGALLAQAGSVFAAEGHSGEGETRESEFTLESREGGGRFSAAAPRRAKAPAPDPEFGHSIEGGW